MSEALGLAVLLNAEAKPEQLKALEQVCPHQCTFFDVQDAAQLQGAVRRIRVAGPTVYSAVVNLCVDEPDCPSGVSAGLAALLCEQAALSYTGCRAAALRYPFDVLMLMLAYAGVQLPPFTVIDSNEAATRAAQWLKAPVQLRSTCPLLGYHQESCTVQAQLEAAMQRAFAEHGKVVVWQVNASPARAVRVLVAGGAVKGAAAVMPLQPCEEAPSWATAAVEAAQRCAAGVNRSVLYGVGAAVLTLDALDSAPGQWGFRDFALTPALSQLLTECDTPGVLAPAVPTAELVASMLAEAKRCNPAPTSSVWLPGEQQSGHHLRAAKAFATGELVFRDEGHSFAIVTRPFVEANWDAELKWTFTEYAWPLDSDGHLYAIWEEDPLRWRPINHSCDPNCIFAAPHSLNVIAARNISAGEDLTMDYATFCDGTMKPFQCFCGKACCRGWIVPDAASLAKYGQNTWLRRVPPPVKPLFPTDEKPT